MPFTCSEQQIDAAMRLSGLNREEAIVAVMDVRNDEVMLNNLYQVNIRHMAAKDGWPAMVHLSVRRLDKQPLGPERFRHLQRIKNELVGPECEAVELYPAESRLVDTSNQYHLWVVPTPGMRFPFGWNQRLIAEQSMGGAVQQPFEWKIDE